MEPKVCRGTLGRSTEAPGGQWHVHGSGHVCLWPCVTARLAAHHNRVPERGMVTLWPPQGNVLFQAPVFGWGKKLSIKDSCTYCVNIKHIFHFNYYQYR